MDATTSNVASPDDLLSLQTSFLPDDDTAHPTEGSIKSTRPDDEEEDFIPDDFGPPL